MWFSFHYYKTASTLGAILEYKNLLSLCDIGTNANMVIIINKNVYSFLTPILIYKTSVQSRRYYNKRKEKRSESVRWQKPLLQQKIKKKKQVTTQNAI